MSKLRKSGIPTGGTTGQVLKKSSNNDFETEWGAGGGSGTPGGSNTQVQYNNSGSFGGISGATSNGTILSVTTASSGTSTTQAASTEFVQQEIAYIKNKISLYLFNAY